jgi:UDP-2,3-diacylglucosamine hydrolase
VPRAAVVVSDAHLGAGERPAPFLRFLATIPDLGTQLVINGDLFEFWFEYGSVIPRRAFPVLSALRQLVLGGVTLTVTVGNHDRWGGSFWREEVGAAFHPEGTRLDLAGWRTAVLHGDGVCETHASARLMHRVTRWPLTAAVFRWLHPDLGLDLVLRMSGRLAQQTRDGVVVEQAARAQAAWAQGFLAREPEVDLLILGHTHRAVLEAVAPHRWYLNPGAWFDGGRYALVGPEGPELREFAVR